MDKQIQVKPIRFALVAMVSTFVIYVLVYILPYFPGLVLQRLDYALASFSYIMVLFFAYGTATIGVLGAVFLGVITYFVFRILGPTNINKKQAKVINCFIIIICAGIVLLWEIIKIMSYNRHVNSIR